MTELDMRGQTCPRPVVETKKAIDAGDLPLVVIVDNEAACENVTRMAKKLGCTVDPTRTDDTMFRLHVTRGAVAAEDSNMAPRDVSQAEGQRRGATVFVSAREMGRGDDKLGYVLMRAFVKTLNELDPRPESIVFVNTGVQLVVEGAGDTVPSLRALADQGVEILVCGTCLDFFGLKEKVAVGRVSNMFEIVETLDKAHHVIEP